MSKVYVVTFTSADSWHSHKTYPHHFVYGTREEAEWFAKAQKGYGFRVDWNVEEWEMLSNC